MLIVKHKFFDHKINVDTETLIIGTFNPNTKGNEADFFYGRPKNYLWRLLPGAYNEQDLKGKSKQEKLVFIKKVKVDFIDIILEAHMEESKIDKYDDKYLDNKVSEWRNVINEIEILKNLKRICFTRSTFSDVPNMKLKVGEIQSYCFDNNIRFECLKTPARFYNTTKQAQWTDFFTK